MVLDSHESAAIDLFALRSTIPIVRETTKGALLLATGTLFEIAGRKFIITARHIFDGLPRLNGEPDLTVLAFPENPRKGGLHTFGNVELFRPVDNVQHVDIAAIELLDPGTISKLLANWKFLTLDNVASAAKESDTDSFFVAGYPSSLTSEVDGWLAGAFTTVHTQRLESYPPEAEQPVVEGLDLFFEYGLEAKSLSGQIIETPELFGVSGASVWKIKSDVVGMWTPEAAIRVVGVQSAFVHSKYFRAKSWNAVVRVLEQVDIHLADELRSRLKQV